MKRVKNSDKKFRINEFIGLDVEIIESKNENYVGIIGKVIDESQNMLIISSGKKIKKIPKNDCVFKFMSRKKPEIKIIGSDIIGRPEDRIKKFLKKNRL